jgi:hypothetical protein
LNQKEYQHEYYLDHRDKVLTRCREHDFRNRKKRAAYRKQYHFANLEKDREHTRQYELRLKWEAIRHYSPTGVCVRCGFGDIRALTIDHINGGGNDHRRAVCHSHFYNWLKKNNYPLGFQVLCMNCQRIKMHENEEWGNRVQVARTQASAITAMIELHE